MCPVCHQKTFFYLIDGKWVCYECGREEKYKGVCKL